MSPTPPPVIAGLSHVVDRYDGFILDLWGCLHDGVRPYPGVIDALKREFAEEIGVRVLSAEPWCGVEHVYPHAHVRLHFYISRCWQGEIGRAHV